MKKETTKELEKLIEWSDKEILEWMSFRDGVKKRLKNKGKKTGKKTKF